MSASLGDGSDANVSEALLSRLSYGWLKFRLNSFYHGQRGQKSTGQIKWIYHIIGVIYLR